VAVVSISKQEFSRLDVLLRVQSGRLRAIDRPLASGRAAASTTLVGSNTPLVPWNRTGRRGADRARVAESSDAISPDRREAVEPDRGVARGIGAGRQDLDLEAGWALETCLQPLYSSQYD